MGDPTVMSHLRAVALGLLLVAFIFCTAPNTYAATVVTGSDIPTQPFEITPDSDLSLMTSTDCAGDSCFLSRARRHPQT
jgi:hypothetical protein